MPVLTVTPSPGHRNFPGRTKFFSLQLICKSPATGTLGSLGSGADFLETYPVDAATADDPVTCVAWLAGTCPLILFCVIAEGKWTAAAVILVKLPRGGGGVRSVQ